MFTGLIEELGTIGMLRPLKEAVELHIECRETLRGVAPGDSIAVDGICLTVTAFGPGGFTTLASAETLRRTGLIFKQEGDKVNLERALTLDKRLGGHLVQGHVDGVGSVSSIRPDGEAQMWRFAVPPELAKYLVSKGSVTVDGISLTVVNAEKDYFSVTIIPKTLAATTLQFRRAGDVVNVETDIIGKYVYKYMHPEESSRVAEPPSIVTSLLQERLAN